MGLHHPLQPHLIKTYYLICGITKTYQIMSAQILTTEDLMEFKVDLISEIEKLLRQNGIQPVKKWLKSKEVRKLLNISPGTLQTLRVNGTLTYSKIGGVIFYEYDEILKMVDRNKTKGY
jgi:hypothetical protein